MVNCQAGIQRRPSIALGLSKYLIDSFEISVGLGIEPLEHLVEAFFSLLIVAVAVSLFKLDEYVFSAGPVLAKS